MAANISEILRLYGAAGVAAGCNQFIGHRTGEVEIHRDAVRASSFHTQRRRPAGWRHWFPAVKALMVSIGAVVCPMTVLL